MDIFERLREFESVKDYWGDWEIAKEAADEIERLREALAQIADFDLYSDYSNAYNMPAIARAALKESNNDHTT